MNLSISFLFLRFGFGLTLPCFMALALPCVAAAEDFAHQGVASCASSTCHGALSPWQESTIRGDEFVIWQQQDPHARAYDTLRSNASQRIAKNLGLGNATQAPLCLSCHSDMPPEALRGARHRIEDGVGCEACHGGAEEWLSLHTLSGTERGTLEKAGLVALQKPDVRGEVCLSCHQGDEARPITHQIYGAGHPRLAFELDTFSSIQPAHYQVDADYVARKGEADSAKIWAQGQAAALKIYAGTSERHQGAADWALYECQACHHSLEKPQWVPRDSVGLPAGQPRRRDDPLLMLRAALLPIDPALAQQIFVQGRALQQGEEGAAAGLVKLAEKASANFAAADFTFELRLKILSGLANGGPDGFYADYAAAEQAVMGMSALLASLRQDKALDEDKIDRLSMALDGCYAALKNYDAWRQQDFAVALKKVSASL